jgi:hypothetical protein
LVITLSYRLLWAADALVCRLVAHSNSTDYISIMPIRKKLQLSGPALAFITTTAKDGSGFQ